MEWISWASEKIWDPERMEANAKAAIEASVAAQTRLEIEDGEWECMLRDDVRRLYMRRYIVLFMFKKGFQGIATGPRTLSFHQDESDRCCVCRFSRLDDGRKRMALTCLHGSPPGFDESSSDAAFFECVLLELSFELAEGHLLLDQAPRELPALQAVSGDTTLIRENCFQFHSERSWMAFLRAKVNPEALVTCLMYLKKKRFAIVEDQERVAAMRKARASTLTPARRRAAKHEVVLENLDLSLRVRLLLACNQLSQPMLYIFYESFASSRKQKRYHDEDSDSDEEENAAGEEKEEEVVPVAQTGDPTLRKGDMDYFASLLLGVGASLAADGFLRSQSFENYFPGNAPLEVQAFQEQALVDFVVTGSMPSRKIVDKFLS